MTYMDESGDLGWELSRPYQHGGSSRYFVIAAPTGIGEAYRKLGSVVDRLHKLQGWTSKSEKKWANVSPSARENFCQLAAAEVVKNPDIHLLVAICDKSKCGGYMKNMASTLISPNMSSAQIQSIQYSHRGRSHLVYSMMSAELFGLHMPTSIKSLAYCPDELNESVRTLDHILAYKLLYLNKCNFELRFKSRNKAMARSLEFADFLAGCVWDAYENNNNTCKEILDPYLKMAHFP